MTSDSSLHKELVDLIYNMPKVELHVHLEGTLHPETVRKLAERHPQHNTLPLDDQRALEKLYQINNFPQFSKIFFAIQNLMRSANDFALAVYEHGRAMAEQHILYSEVMVAPYTHTHMQNKQLNIEELLQGLEEGSRSARQDFGVEIRWIFGFARNFCVRDNGSYDLEPAETTLEHALAGRPQGVIGLTVGGDEALCPPDPFEGIFKTAKSKGLLSVPHAGETLFPTSAYMWTSIEKLEADRIGHGVRAVDDPDLIDLLRERGIPLDINLTSNRSLLYPDISQHPFPQLNEAGLTLTINSDDPAILNTTLNREYELLSEVFDYPLQEIVRLARNAFAVCGAPPELKRDLLTEFDRWCTQTL